MKKLVLFFLMSLLLQSCDPPKWMCRHEASWYFKNSTDKELEINFAVKRMGMDGIFKQGTMVVAPNDSSFFHYFQIAIAYKKFPSFDGIRLDSVYVMSEGKELRHWLLVDPNPEEHDIFEESSWKLYIKYPEKEKYRNDPSVEHIYTWVYEFTEADIKN